MRFDPFQMRSGIRVMSVAVGLFGVWPLAALAGPIEDFDKLDEQMGIATQEYYEALDKVTARNGSIKVGAKIPVDQRPAILRKMDALVASAADTPVGGVLAGKTLLRSMEVQSERTFARFQILVGQYPNEPLFDEVLDVIPYVYVGLGADRDWAGVLEKLARVATRKQTRLGAYAAAGQILVDHGKPAQAEALFTQLLKLAEQYKASSAKLGTTKEDPSLSPYLASAKGFLFELKHLQVGMEAPDFVTQTLRGKEISLRSLRGKVVLLNFWATWCVNCVAETPYLKTAVSKLKSKPFEILAISVDDDRRSLLQTIQVMGIPGIHTWDAKGEENPIAALYHVYRYPTQYLIDAEGVIRARDPDVTHLTARVESILPSPH